jgi:alkylhydroperoxidase family enzyme
MLGFLVKRQIRSREKEFGVPLDYLVEMYETAPDAFWAFTKLTPAAEYRGKVPPAPYHVARLVATRHADCGTCVQLVVNMAKKDGVEQEVLKAVLGGRVEELPESLRDVYRFAQAVVTQNGEAEPYRDRLKQVFGAEAVVELAMAIAMCQVFPTLKRGLGHAKSCSVVKVDV